MCNIFTLFYRIFEGVADPLPRIFKFYHFPPSLVRHTQPSPATTVRVSRMTDRIKYLKPGVTYKTS